MKKTTENEWFLQYEKDMIRNMRRERERKEKALAESLKHDEGRKRKELHWMKCPKCGAALYEQAIHGISIDFCPICDGVFFDRKELEELLLKSKSERKAVVSWIIHHPEDLDVTDHSIVLEAVRAWRQHKDKEIAWLVSHGEAKANKDLHWMKCPKCGNNLTADEIHGVRAEHCAACLGMFLDRVELQELFFKQVEERRNIVSRMLKAMF